MVGEREKAVLGLKNDMYVTLPVGQGSGLQANADVSSHLKAPIIKGKNYGTLNIVHNGKMIASQPLIALQNNDRTNFIFALYDYALMLFQHQ